MTTASNATPKPGKIALQPRTAARVATVQGLYQMDLAGTDLNAVIDEFLRLRFPKGEAAKHYNALQKLAYFGTAVVLLPLMALTEMLMNEGVDVLTWQPACRRRPRATADSPPRAWGRTKPIPPSWRSPAR
jgi:hypothetical protein